MRSFLLALFAIWVFGTLGVMYLKHDRSRGSMTDCGWNYSNLPE
jgi:hypothetical protein